MSGLYRKCDSLGKYHLCCNMFDPSRVFSAEHYLDIFVEPIVQCIPEDLRLCDIFQRWSSLSPVDRAILDESMFLVGSHLMYRALKTALTRWNDAQDTLGAPGFDSGMFAFTCSQPLNDELESLICQIDTILGPAE